MKYRIYITILSLVLLATVMTACNKKLTEYNPSGLTASTVYNNAKGFDALVNASYSFMRFWYGKEEGYSLSEMGTDIWTSGTGDVFPQLSQYNNLQGGNTAALTMEWNNFYAALNLINLGLSGITEVSGYTDQQKTLREAELRFLRAFYNWHIVETWGDVHFSLLPSVGAVSTANKTPVDTFYKYIISDLQFAVSNLPATQTDYGRATQAAAKGFLARMYLTRGMNNEAIAMANDVIKNYGLSLQTNYASLWNMGNLKNKEVVWALDYSTTLTYNDLLNNNTYPNGHPRGSNSGHLLFLMVYDQVSTAILIRDLNNGRPFNRYMPTKALLDMFDPSIDSRYNASFQTVWYANKAGTANGNTFVAGDTAAVAEKVTLTPAEMNARKYFTYDISKVYGADDVPIQRRFYVSLKKFKDSTRASLAEAQSARDVYIIRLAEMYLIAAEAEMKIGKLDSAAYYLNVVRRRAAWPGQEANMEIAESDVTLDFILDERARELAGEQLRWFDLKRTNTLVSRIQGMNPDAAQYVQPYHRLRPIPQQQLDAVTNKQEFTQNEGYQ